MRGQVGLEFFLILGFCLVMLTILISNSEKQLTENEKLDSAVLSLSALNAVSNAVNTVAIQGNGAQMTVSAYIPKKAKCFLETSEQRLACDIGDAYGRRVYGMRLMATPDTINDACYTVYGWMDVTVKKSFGSVEIFCSMQT
ncbi:MAG: hypothetical protein WCX64_00410 [Candidatus Micrarchaeia archaeon]|jgi:uncharacterized protein (UPF0333 family)